MKYPFVWLAILFLASCSKQIAYIAATGTTNTVVPVRNAIILVANGAGPDEMNLLRWKQDGRSLRMDPYASAWVRTHSSDALIGDPAANATAYATGHKTHVSGIGVLGTNAGMPYATTNAPPNRPVANLMEAARLEGKATGLVMTGATIRATPAAFSTHIASEEDTETIGEQQLYQGFDVVFGGGKRYFTQVGRRDNRNLLVEMEKQGYSVFTNVRDFFDFAGEGKVWGLFADQAMAFDIERVPSKEPSLADMTARAIDLLSPRAEGFVLMVEGSQINKATEATDPVGQLSELAAFDKAVGVAMEFAKTNKRTAVVVLVSHGADGLGIGNTSLSNLMKSLNTVKHTAAYLAQRVARNGSNAIELLASQGVSNLSSQQIADVQMAKGGDLITAFGRIIAQHAQLSYQSHGHMGGNAVLYSYLPYDQRIRGVLDSTDVGRFLAKSLSLDLDLATKQLFVSLTDRQRDYSMGFKDGHRILTLHVGGRIAQMTQNQNTIKIDKQTFTLPGIVVFSDQQWYVPQAALDMVGGSAPTK